MSCTFPLPAAFCPILAACCLLPAACCLLPAACCLLPAACCLLPAAHQLRRPTRYDEQSTPLLGPSWPDPTLDTSTLGICSTLVRDSPRKLFIVSAVRVDAPTPAADPACAQLLERADTIFSSGQLSLFRCSSAHHEVRRAGLRGARSNSGRLTAVIAASHSASFLPQGELPPLDHPLIN